MKDSRPEAARHSIPESCSIANLSRSTLYDRIQKGLIKVVKDGRRSFIMREELERYLKSCEAAQ